MSMSWTNCHSWRITVVYSLGGSAVVKFIHTLRVTWQDAFTLRVTRATKSRLSHKVGSLISQGDVCVEFQTNMAQSADHHGLNLTDYPEC